MTTLTNFAARDVEAVLHPKRTSAAIARAGQGTRSTLCSIASSVRWIAGTSGCKRREWP